MNKKTISKINLFLQGLFSRMEENRSYFQNIRFQLKSGTKQFPALVTAENGGFYLEYQAVKTEVRPEELLKFAGEELLKFEEALIIYQERGAQILIEASDKNVKMRQGDNEAQKEIPETAAVNIGREYVVNPARAKELLMEIGILAKNGKIKNDKIRKYNQIDYFVELMAGVLKELPEQEEWTIMDCACGKSYLSFVLNFYFREILKKKCRFIGVDYSETVIEASKKIANNLGYHNMEFIKEDLTVYTPKEKIDVVISLHACDTATDMALALGIRAKAKAIVSVPCCHKDLLKQYSYEPFAPILKHGILKARLADTLTDGLRGVYLESKGYRVSMIEYISPLETPKNIMIRSIYTGKPRKNAREEYDTLKQMLHVRPAIETYGERMV